MRQPMSLEASERNLRAVLNSGTPWDVRATSIPFPEARRLRAFSHPLVSIALLLGLVSVATGKDPTDYARDFKTQLAQKILPYWYDTAVDRQNGGYLLSDDAAKKAAPATEKQLVTQSRMIWGFSHAHLKGFSDQKRNYLRAAEQGYHFLLDHFLDREKGGYYWTTDVQGKPIDQRKIVYGESFVIYGLVEYYRASGDKGALQHALDLYHVLQKRAHDPKYGGWIEHLQRDWTPILDPNAEAIVELAGCKSANTHLHLLESLTDLYAATHDPEVQKSLAEAVKINCTWFYPKDPGKSAFHRRLDWTLVTGPRSSGVSYGHNVEFAWLMIRAEEVLGQKPSWEHFDAHLEHALKYGYDRARGGLYSRGVDDQPATDTDKVWWVQAEMLAALTDGLRHKPNAAYRAALDKLLQFIVTYQADPADGIWLDTVAADGKPKVTAKAHNWKANYHDVRAIVKFVEAYGPAR
jgi:cellobiose epimerase